MKCLVKTVVELEVEKKAVLGKVIDPVPFRPERPVPVKIPGQNGDVFVPDRIPDRSGHSGQIPAGTPRFCTGGSVPVSRSRSLVKIINDQHNLKEFENP